MDDTGESSPLVPVGSLNGFEITNSLSNKISDVKSAEESCWDRLLGGIAVLYVTDKILALLFAFVQVDFPSSLVGCGLILSALLICRRFNPSLAAKAHNYFDESVAFITHKYLPIFYAPALISLPLALRPFSSLVMLKSIIIVCIGYILTVILTGNLALIIRRLMRTDLLPVEWHPSSVLFNKSVIIAWSVAIILAFLGILVSIPGSTWVFMLSSTVIIYIVSMSSPQTVQSVLHPMVLCAILENILIFLLGWIRGVGFWGQLEEYISTRGTHGVLNLATPGDALFSWLGVIILSFGFRIYSQWHLIERHGAELIGSTVFSAFFSLIVTALLGRAFRLPSEVIRGLVPRSATMALALPAADVLHAPRGITAAAVALTGIAGASTVVQLLNILKLEDPICRGISAAASAHGLGTAALGANEPIALPFAGLAYALCGISVSLLVNLPPMMSLIFSITG